MRRSIACLGLCLALAACTDGGYEARPAMAPPSTGGAKAVVVSNGAVGGATVVPSKPPAAPATTPRPGVDTAPLDGQSLAQRVPGGQSAARTPAARTPAARTPAAGATVVSGTPAPRPSPTPTTRPARPPAGYPRLTSGAQGRVTQDRPVNGAGFYRADSLTPVVRRAYPTPPPAPSEEELFDEESLGDEPPFDDVEVATP